jgi:hypothetical protein
MTDSGAPVSISASKHPDTRGVRKVHVNSRTSTRATPGTGGAIGRMPYAENG